jgi:hypothetical protein
MKPIEEALDEHIRSMQEGGCIPNYEENDFNAGNQYGFEQGFMAGVEFAQRWISVDEELPKLDVPVLIKMIYRLENIVSVAYRTREINSITGKEEIIWRANLWQNLVRLTITHWRHIELKQV